MNPYKLCELPAAMRRNRTNTLTTFDADGGKRVRTFSEVYDEVCRATVGMQARGAVLEPGQRAVLIGTPSYDWLLAALVCLFTGVEPIALPETLTAEEMHHSLEAIDFQFVIAHGKARDAGFMSDALVIPMEDLTGQFFGELPDFDELRAHAMIAFTSGSTAQSKLKGFRVDLTSTEDFTRSFTTAFDIRHDDLWAVCHSFSHIVHFEYVLGGLSWGYDLAIVDVMGMLLNGAELRPSVLVTVPSVYEQIAGLIRNQFDGEDDPALATLMEAPVVDENNDIVRRPLSPQAASVVGDRIKMMLIGAAPSSMNLKRFLLQMGLPMYEGYGMSELNMISCSIPGASRLGAVGPCWSNVEVRIQDGAIQARTLFPRSNGYLNVSEAESALAVLPGGWVDTGDLGEMTDGYLTISGRKKEIIITKGGKNINAAALQARLQELPDIGHALVFGDNQPFLVAVLAPKAGQFSADKSSLLAQIGALNKELPMHERIVDIVCLNEPLSVENGLLTRSAKPRRNLVAQRYQTQIEECYQ